MIKSIKQTGFKNVPDADIAAIAFCLSIAVHVGMLVYGGNFWDFSSFDKSIPKTQVLKLEHEKAALLPEIQVIGQVKQISEPQNPQQLSGKQTEAELKVKGSELSAEQIKTEKDKAQKAMLRYQDMIKQRIEAFRKYPMRARRNNTEGIVALKFDVLSDGVTKALRIVKSSGSTLLDQEALGTIGRASPFLPLPAEIAKKSVTIHVAIVFSLK